MNRFTTNSFKKQKGLFGILCLFMIFFSSSFVQAQTCNPARVLTGNAVGTTGGLCLGQWGSTSNAGDGDINSAASANAAIGNCTFTMEVKGSTTYPAGSTWGVVMASGGGDFFSNIFGSLTQAVTVELLNGSTVVQTINSSSLLDVTTQLFNQLGGSGNTKGAVGGIANAAFNGYKVTYNFGFGALTGVQVFGALVSGGCVKFECTQMQIAATNTSGFLANGVAGQQGTLTIPLSSVSEAGPIYINVSGGGFSSTQNPHLVNISAGQSSISVPVTYNGTGSIGNHTVTVKQQDVSQQDLVNGSCSIQVPVNGKFAFNCGQTSASINPSNFINNGTPQSATVSLPISNAVAGSVQITLDNSSGLGADFQGTYTATLTNGQSVINIPANALTNFFDGTGVNGTRTLTFTSPDATNTCTANVTVGDLFQFNCGTTSAVVSPSSFVSNGTAQSATVTLPISNASAGTTIISLDNANGLGSDFSGTYNATITAGQTQITIPSNALPNFFDGTGTVGTRTLTFKTSSGTSTCTANVNVVQPLTVANEQVPLNLGGQTVYTGNVRSEAIPSQGVEIAENSGKYNYYVIDCINENYTSGTETSTQSILTSIAGVNPVTGASYATNLSSLANGTIVLNRAAGTYTYNKDMNSASTVAKFCVRIEDKDKVSPHKIVEYNLVNAGSAVVNAPVISSNPNPPVAGSPATFTATGCSGTVNWLANGTPTGQQGASVSITAPSNGVNYTATCTVGSTTSAASNTITSGGSTGGGGDLAIAFTTNPGSSFGSGTSKSYVITVRNIGTSPSQAANLSISSAIGGFSISGGGSQSIGSLAAGGQQTFTVSATANNKGSAGALSAVITGSGETNTTNNSASVPVSVAN